MPVRSFAVIPAAGKSRRMGQDKLLMPWGNVTVIESLLESWRASDVDEVVVVTREDQVELRKLCRDVSVLTCAIAPPEMKDSVSLALVHIRETFAPTEQDVWLLAPADMPHLDAAIANRVLAEHALSAPAIIVPEESGRRGHPVLFPWALAAEVDKLASDEGVNALLRKFPVRVVESESARIHGDLDTPEDYERLRDNY